MAPISAPADLWQIRIKSTNSSSIKYGVCEECGRHASEVFVLIIEGQRTFETVFGHDACLRKVEKHG